jgi:prolipoprotein diacylglyceryltransferase
VHLPLYLHIGPWTLHAHTVFELLAYFVGFRLYLRQRRRRGDVIGGYERWWLVAAAIAGGAIGSRALAWAESPALVLDHLRDSGDLLGGKTVVGGLLGGTIAVEVTKRALGIVRRTGDLFAVPLAIGISIGRIGCFFEGPGDETWGGPTNLPWGVDPGDGLARYAPRVTRSGQSDCRPAPKRLALELAAYTIELLKRLCAAMADSQR